jgi:hypothetical protein
MVQNTHCIFYLKLQTLVKFVRSDSTVTSHNLNVNERVKSASFRSNYRLLKPVTNYNQQDATFLEFIYFYRRSTCFWRFLRPSSGAHTYTYSFRYCQSILLLTATMEKMELSSISSTVAASSSIGWQYLKLYVYVCAPDDGRRNRPKHVKRL